RCRAGAVEPGRGDRRVPVELHRARRVRRRRALPPPEHGGAGMGDVQPHRHRLGTAPELRPMVSRDTVMIGIPGRPIAPGRIGAAAAVGVGVGYLAALERAGATPVVLAPRALETADARALLARVDGLL